MNVVLDPSAAAEIVLRRPSSGPLERLVAEAEWVRTPDLYVPETTNLFWKRASFAHVPRERCEAALRHAVRLPDELVPTDALYEEVFSLACRANHPAYDWFYLVLARRHGAVLATMDRKLVGLCDAEGVRHS